MGQQVALFHFRVEGLWIRGEILGESFFLERRDGAPVLLSLPADQEESFPASIQDDELFRRSIFNEKTGVTIAGAVRVIQVAVGVESQVSVEDPPEADKSDAQAAFDEAFKIAVAVADDFVAWLRVLAEQHWLGPSHELPELVGRADLIDVENGQLGKIAVIRNVSVAQSLILTVLQEEDALSRDVLEEVFEQLAGEGEPPTGETLLADARQALSPPGVQEAWRADRRDLSRAVLLAAIAVEVKVKQTLREKTPAGTAQDLVEIIITKPREVSIATGQLVHHTMKAAVGRSLKEDNRDVFNSVQRLFEVRNDIAHRGSTPTSDQAGEAVDAARNAFTWLDGLPMP